MTQTVNIDSAAPITLSSAPTTRTRVLVTKTR